MAAFDIHVQKELTPVVDMHLDFFTPVAIETAGVVAQREVVFLKDLGQCPMKQGGDSPTVFTISKNLYKNTTDMHSK